MGKRLKIKVCGIKSTSNRKQVEALDIDLLGYIFYPLSKRFIGERPESGLFQTSKPAVGVFVNENAFEILGLAKNFGFSYIQLHGKENPKTCSLLKKQGLKIIKSFPIDENFDFSPTQPFEEACDFFLFDTKTKFHGGSGQKFDWSILKRYKGEIPFLLSGGLAPGDAPAIKKLDHPSLAGVDLNSGFEDAPGQKNIEKLQQFITALNK